jgi:putative hemolysin
MTVALQERTGARELARAGRLAVRLASGLDEVEAAQRLRWEVFSLERGARLGDDRCGLDRDAFDPWCEHLVVEDEASGRIVGTYRVLLPEQAARAGGLYMASEFRIERLRGLRGEIAELGRSCVHRDYRTGGTIMLLWSGLGELLATTGCRYLVGCASVPAADGGDGAAKLWRRLWLEHAAPDAWRVFPRRPLAVAPSGPADEATMPPLLKGYLRAGSLLLGAPHLDPEFVCADFPLMLPLERLGARYSRRFARG